MSGPPEPADSEQFAGDPDGSEVEVPLVGGDVTEGVVRVGQTVRRPLGDHSALVHAVLGHLATAGFEGAPRFLGVDAAGREILTFIEGEVAGRPWPDWVGDEDRAVSVARLVRRLDDALIPLGVPPDVREPAAPLGVPDLVGPPTFFLGHRDLTPENTVFRGGTAYALLDFDLVGPASRVTEMTNLLLWWAGWMHPDDRDAAFAEVDPAARGRLLVDAYGLDPDDRAWVVPAAISGAARSWFAMKHRAETRGGGWRRMWDDGVGDQIRRREAWLRDNARLLDRTITS